MIDERWATTRMSMPKALQTCLIGVDLDNIVLVKTVEFGTTVAHQILVIDDNRVRSTTGRRSVCRTRCS